MADFFQYFHKLGMGVGLAATLGVYFLIKKWLQDRKEVQLARLAEAGRQFDAEQTTKKMEIFAKSLQRLPKDDSLKKLAEQPPLSNFTQ